MSSMKYSRLPSNLGPRKYKFQALEGPGYFTYDAQPGKYSSMFTYSRAPSNVYSPPPPDSSTTSLLAGEAHPVNEHATVYGDQNHGGDTVRG